jgi:hypothetical protein
VRFEKIFPRQKNMLAGYRGDGYITRIAGQDAPNLPQEYQSLFERVAAPRSTAGFKSGHCLARVRGNGSFTGGL